MEAPRARFSTQALHGSMTIFSVEGIGHWPARCSSLYAPDSPSRPRPLALKFPAPLVPGTLLKRYKRFLVDVRLDDGRFVTAHTPNTGAMAGCSEPGSRVWLSPADRPQRKLKWTLEIVRTLSGVLVGVHTALPNALVVEGIQAGLLSTLQGYDRLRREVRYGREGSRIDVLLERDPSERIWIEVKNVTLVEGERALFPDAVTARGRKHLRELREVVAQGDRGVLIFTLQRADGQLVSPADGIDPAYGAELRVAAAAGVELLAYRAAVSPEEIRLVERVPVVV